MAERFAGLTLLAAAALFGLLNPAVAAPTGARITMDAADGTTAVIRIEGVISRPLEAEVLAAFDALPKGRPLLVDLDSPGGYTAAGYAIIDRMLAERKAGRIVATRVGRSKACESMCVGLFLAGHPRYAAPDAQFMVHAPRLRSGGGIPLKATRAMVERLGLLGASPEWLARVRIAGGFSGATDHRESARELMTDNANVVTQLVE